MERKKMITKHTVEGQKREFLSFFFSFSFPSQLNLEVKCTPCKKTFSKLIIKLTIYQTRCTILGGSVPV